MAWKLLQGDVLEFQFLIGRLDTRFDTKLARKELRFNSS